ncbi:MAG: PP0621 family protein [Rhodoferax sp.]
MRVLVLFAVALFVAWRVRSWLHRRTAPTRSPLAAPTAMLPCNHCGVHVPSGEAVQGAHGHYCCTAHRAAAEH